MTEQLRGLMDFLKESPTCFQAVDALRARLTAAGYAEINECDPWQLAPGGKYFTTRNESSLIAFVMPAGKLNACQIVAAHTDSPTFKIKDVADMKTDKYLRLNVEKCGGSIFSTWFDRPLSVAGRVIV